MRNAAHFPQGFSDERHGDVVVVRPMREHTLKEVAFYNRLFAVPSVFTPAIDTKVGRRQPPPQPVGRRGAHAGWQGGVGGRRTSVRGSWSQGGCSATGVL